VLAHALTAIETTIKAKSFARLQNSAGDRLEAIWFINGLMVRQKCVLSDSLGAREEILPHWSLPGALAIREISYRFFRLSCRLGAAKRPQHSLRISKKRQYMPLPAEKATSIRG
jgi:hypothetical protein